MRIAHCKRNDNGESTVRTNINKTNEIRVFFRSQKAEKNIEYLLPIRTLYNKKSERARNVSQMKR